MRVDFIRTRKDLSYPVDLAVRAMLRPSERHKEKKRKLKFTKMIKGQRFLNGQCGFPPPSFNYQ